MEPEQTGRREPDQDEREGGRHTGDRGVPKGVGDLVEAAAEPEPREHDHGAEEDRPRRRQQPAGQLRVAQARSLTRAVRVG